jgi:excisionase family DNA binding protein
MSDDNDQSNPMDSLTVGELISLVEAAELSGFSLRYLQDIAKRGRLQAKKIGREWLTTMAAVEEYKRTRKFIAKDD